MALKVLPVYKEQLVHKVLTANKVTKVKLVAMDQRVYKVTLDYKVAMASKV